MNKLKQSLAAALLLASLSGCTVLAVADFAVSTAVTVGKTAVKATGAVVGVTIDGVKALSSKDEPPETVPATEPQPAPAP